MIWACFLHFYQPPTQKRYWVDRITDECYRRLIHGLLENPQARITLNVNSILCELWETYGHQDVLDGLAQLVQRGQVELTGSAKFHPLLPKLPKEMVVRQIILNEISLNQYFGVVGPALRKSETNSRDQNLKAQSASNFNLRASSLVLKGFFPPEMAYNRYLAEIVAGLGYEWIIAEELSLGRSVDYDRLYSVSGVYVKESPLQVGEELRIFFRDRAFSYKVLAGYLGTEKLFLDGLKERFPDSAKQQFLLTAMDGETFGHHRPGMERLLFDLFKIPEIGMLPISDLLKRFTQTESVETKPSTWALMEHEVERNLPFARWDDPGNEVHKLQWQLTESAIKSVKAFSLGQGADPNVVPEAQRFLDRALHSDQYWWASAKPWWSIEYIERGAKELLTAVKATGDVKAARAAQKLYYQILETAFEYQRCGKVDEISRQEDETIRMRTDQTLPKMPKEELLKIIQTIQQEMQQVAANQEFERAAQLRDRIKELEAYLPK